MTEDVEEQLPITRRHALRRTDGVVQLELANVIPMITLTMWLTAGGGVAVDNVVAILALKPGHGATMHVLEYEGDLQWKTSIEWSPLVGVTVSLNDSYDVPEKFELWYDVVWDAEGGNRTFVDSLSGKCNVTAEENKCDSKKIPQQEVRRGVQAPYGGPILVIFTMLNGTDEILADPDMLIVRSMSMSPIYSNFATYSGAIMMLTIGAYIVRYIYMLFNTSEPVATDQILLCILLPLFYFQLQSLLAVVFLGQTSSNIDSSRLRTYLTICPYIFTHALQATLYGLFNYYKPRGKLPYVKMTLWFTLMTTMSTVFAGRAEDYEQDIVSVAWDRQTGVNTQSNTIAAMTYTGLRWLFVINLARKVISSHRGFVSAPFLVHRNRYLKMSLISAMAIAMVCHEFGTGASHVFSVAPMQGTSLGACWIFAVIILGLAYSLMPVYVKGDDSMPPPPSGDEWKGVAWTLEWKRWVAQNKLALTLYYFITTEEETAFWEVQNKGEQVPIHESPSLFVPRNIGVTIRTAILVLRYSVTAVCLQVLSLFFLLPSLIFGIIFPKIFTFYAYIQRRCTAYIILLLYELPPRSEVIGMFPVDAEHNTLAGNLCNRHTWLSLFYGQIIMWLSYVTAVFTIVTGVMGAVLSWFFVTSSLGTILLTIQHIVTSMLLRLQRGIAVCLLVQGSAPEEKPATADTKEYVIAPFCLQTCAAMSHVAYESYRRCPRVDEETIAGSEEFEGRPKGFAGLLPRSGLVSANALAPGGKSKDRRIDVARYGLDLKHIGVVAGLQFLVGTWSEARAVFVSFRGTSNTQNKKTDLNVRRRPWKEMREEAGGGFLSCWGSTPQIHRGFCNLWDTVKPTVLEKVMEAMEKSGFERVFVTGHSLGAAVATLAAYSFSKKFGSSAVGVYAFGTPLLGNQAFANYMNFSVPYNMNLKHENDACTTYAGTFGNIQSGHEIAVGRCGQILVNPSWVERLSSPWSSGGNPFAAHKIVRYQTSLTVAAALFESDMVIIIGEESEHTNKLAWVLGRSYARHPIGLEIGYPLNGALVTARVVGFPRKGMTRIRPRLAAPVDVPTDALGKPPTGPLTPIPLKPFPSDAFVTTGGDPATVISFAPAAASPDQPNLEINYDAPASTDPNWNGPPPRLQPLTLSLK